ncbi:MAG: hypothetical protein V1701_02845 [Planctomycetota bacterium]
MDIEKIKFRIRFKETNGLSERIVSFEDMAFGMFGRLPNEILTIDLLVGCDKNNNEVYEYDIVRVVNGNPPYNEYRGVIIYDEQKKYWVIKWNFVNRMGVKAEDQFNQTLQEDIELVDLLYGNYHDHPELLK